MKMKSVILNLFMTRTLFYMENKYSMTDGAITITSEDICEIINKCGKLCLF